MTQVENCNCIVCAQEFNPGELQSIALSKINTTRFKICQACLDLCEPEDDYRQARDIVDGYLKFAEARSLFAEASDILNSVKNKS
jgi:hypothetical protein